MKKPLYIAIAVCLLACVCIAGCSILPKTGSEPRIDNAMGIMHEFTIWMSYDRFDGVKDYVIDVRGDSEISVDVSTLSGSLSVQIFQEGKAPIYKGTLDSSTAGQFKVGAADGTYTIRLEGKKHKGSFSFNW